MYKISSQRFNRKFATFSSKWLFTVHIIRKTFFLADIFHNEIKGREFRFTYINPFVPNAPFLCPLKTSEKRKASYMTVCYQLRYRNCLRSFFARFDIAFYSHCVKSVQIRSFFRSAFSCIQSEYEKIRTRKNFVFGHFSHSVYHSKIVLLDSNPFLFPTII